MLKKLIIILLVIFGFKLSAQKAISGFVEMGDPTQFEQKVYLTKTFLKDIPDYSKAKKIAASTIDKEGYFEFKRNVLEEKEAVYRLYVNRIEKILKDTIQFDKLFLLSKNDSIHFRKAKVFFSDYSNTNIADKEWQRLRNYESELKNATHHIEDSLADDYVASMKSYAKDSLQILIVKLIGIKQLENKNLLDKDILINPEYYTDILAQLKKSDIERSEYLFLENKLAFITTELVESKYQTNRIILLLLLVVIGGLVLLIFQLKRKNIRRPLIVLSKQEKNIQGLILEGKSNKEIADELFISLSTVKTHISNIYSKLHISNRQELLHKHRN